MQQEIVRTWMTPNPTTISTTATLDEAHQLMKALHVRHLPVVADQQLIGLISKTDVHWAKLALAASEAKQEMPVPNTVADVVSASTSKASIEAHELVSTAAQTMLDQHLMALPVLEDGRLIGILTTADIFRMVIESSG